MRNYRGFTLVELMVTVAVAAILISVAVPSFRNMIISNRLSTISSDLADVMSLARSESIKRNRPITFCRASAANKHVCSTGKIWSHWIIKQNMDSSEPDDVISRGSISSYNGSIEVTTANLTDSKISFSTDGLARSNAAPLSSARITVCTTSGIADPIRHTNIGAASKVTITKDSGDCP